VRITTIGHAGFFIETAGGTIVCDPWFLPAFFGSWFPYPRNDRLPAALAQQIEHPDYLYVSHLHGDHLDLSWLADHIDRSAVVLLPDFPTRELERTLRQLGFEHFVQTRDGQVHELGGLEVSILVETAVADGPQGDSTLIVADADGHFVNQNDCRPHDFSTVVKRRPVDIHALQFSGAIWYPMVYEMDAEAKARLMASKREAQLSRAVQYVRMVNAPTVVGSAGPPAFLDPELWHLNDFSGLDGHGSAAASIFPDQTVFIDRLASEGIAGATLAVPGTVITIVDGVVSVQQPPDAEAAFSDKAKVMRAYADDWSSWLDEHKASWLQPSTDLVEQLTAWFEPLMRSAPHVCAGVAAPLLLKLTGSEPLDIVIDFPQGEVRRAAPIDPADVNDADVNDEYGFRFTIDRRIVETVVARRAVDWSNALFLSCRFSAWRAGDYNEYVYSFFKSLSAERMARAEAEAANAQGDGSAVEMIACGDMMIERFCPHRKADLTTFGEISGDVITCTLHGWQFDISSGRCLTSTSARPLSVRRPEPATKPV
jgi:UDP-MurNAc hydroxylase